MSEWIVVPGWEKFQHYKDRNPVWIKLYLELNSRDDWRQLTFGQRGLLVSVWLEYGRSNGRLRVPSLWGRVGQTDRHGNLDALVEAGLLELSASPGGLALARSQEAEGEPSKDGSPLREATRSPLESGESPDGERDPHAVTHVRELVDQVFGTA